MTVASIGDDEGKPLDVFAVRATHPLLAEAALAAVHEWRLAPERAAVSQWRGSVVRLEPPRVRGRPVVVADSWEFRFAEIDGT